MLATGDFEMMMPLFRMYRQMLPLALERTRIYHNHEGAFFPETLYPWGTYTNDCYGWDRNGMQVGDIANPFIRNYRSGGIEFCAMMTDYFAYTGDRRFAAEIMLPIADGVMTYYANHYPKDNNGKLVMKPAQSLETWWDVINPLPETAGLHKVLTDLLQLPTDLTSAAQRSRWKALQTALPPIPTTGENGELRILPFETNLGTKGNMENPELYAVFPFRLYGVGKPDLDVGVRTYDARETKVNVGWCQDPIEAALLGKTQDAANMVVERFGTKHAGSRFPAFWGPNFDWIPDQDHGSVAETALQLMLLQTEGRKILLFPAWPKDWDVQFKLHAPINTTVEGSYKNGNLEWLHVTPASRAKDVVNMSAGGGG
jgi:hypothetical protein